MSDLTSKKCVPCEGGTLPLPAAAVDQYQKQLTQPWDYANERISRTFEFDNFSQAIVFVNRVAQIAESEGHHPDIHIEDYNTVRIVLWTHAIKGLSVNDFIVAAKIEQL